MVVGPPSLGGASHPREAKPLSDHPPEDREILPVPYRLETVEAITRAKNANFLELNHDYDIMLSFAEKVTLSIPPALRKARQSVSKDFLVLDEKKQTFGKIDYVAVANLNLVDNFRLIEESIPWVAAIAAKPSFVAFLQDFPDLIGQPLGPADTPEAATQMYRSLLNAFRQIKRELFACVHSKRSASLSQDELKRLIAARALFEPGNADVLKGLQVRDQASEAKYQNACAELLFVRIPVLLNRLCGVDTKLVRRKLLDKIAKLGASPSQRMALFNFFKPDTPVEKLKPTMDKMLEIANKILEPARAEKLRDYLSSLEQKIEFERKIYEHLFLSPELAQMRSLHVSCDLQDIRRYYAENVIRRHTHAERLVLYPVKDYLDVSKYRISGDCTGTGLAVQHLMTPQYFSIRIFWESKWRGNVYMLDFTEKHGVLLVDRIQIPRNMKAAFVGFFKSLHDMLGEMFADVEYKKILLPMVISNHQFVQSAYNKYRLRLGRMAFDPAFEQKSSFDSFHQAEGFFVLYDRSSERFEQLARKAAGNAPPALTPSP